MIEVGRGACTGALTKSQQVKTLVPLRDVPTTTRKDPPKRPGIPREKVLATVVQLLEKTLIRVGNDEYARQNQSFGLTTLRDAQVAVRGGRVRFATSDVLAWLHQQREAEPGHGPSGG